MKINIRAPWEVNVYLADLIKEKMNKLAKVNDRIIHADVFLKMGDNVGVEDKLVDIRLKAPRQEYFAHSFAENFEKAVAQTAHKLRAQLVKKKEKMQGR